MEDKYKIFISGSGSHSGIFSLFNRIMYNIYDPNLRRKTTYDHGEKIIIYNNRSFILQLETWHFYRISPFIHNYKNSQAILLILDLTNSNSFWDIKRYCNLFYNIYYKELKEEPPITYIIGNKADLVEKRIISKEEAVNLCNKYGYRYCEVSMLNGEKIQELLHLLLRDLIDRRSQKQTHFEKNTFIFNNKKCLIF